MAQGSFSGLSDPRLCSQTAGRCRGARVRDCACVRDRACVRACVIVRACVCARARSGGEPRLHRGPLVESRRRDAGNRPGLSLSLSLSLSPSSS